VSTQLSHDLVVKMAGTEELATFPYNGIKADEYDPDAAIAPSHRVFARESDPPRV